MVFNTPVVASGSRRDGPLAAQALLATSLQRQPLLLSAPRQVGQLRGSYWLRRSWLATAHPSASGLRLVHLTDWHLDHHTAPWLAALIQVVNTLQPDVVVCTGDFITKGTRWLDPLTTLLQQINAPHRLATLGNHDYQDGGRSHHVRQAIAAGGFTLLVNDAYEALAGVRVVGLDDFTHGCPDPARVQTLLAPDKTNVLLAHNPAQLEAVETWPHASVVLCGHTHGGQWNLIQPVVRYIVGSRYVTGFYAVGPQRQLVHVNCGAGTAALSLRWRGRWHTLPVPRLQTWPEISYWTLSSGLGTAPLSAHPQ